MFLQKFALAVLTATTLVSTPLMSEVVSVETATSPTQPSQWMTNLDAAKAQAKNENKPIYLLFTGTSWCSWCIKMEKEVYDKPSFWKSFQDKMIFVKYDIGSKRTAEQTHLMDMYGVMGVPAMLILNADGKEIARLGYPSNSMGGGKTALEVHSAQLSDVLNRAK